MAQVVADMSMSLDGFVADPSDGVRDVFAWYGKPQPEQSPREPSGEADTMGVGVIVYGRRTFELADGWGGNHPVGVPVMIVTHEVPNGWPREGSSVFFDTGGIESAMAAAGKIAGDRIIALGSPSVIQQCLALGLVDRIQVKLVPVLLGDGIRLFGTLVTAPVELGNPAVSEGNGVTHLHYDVALPGTAPVL